MDSDIYKTLEAVSWELARDAGTASDRALAAFAAEATDLLVQAQQPDGYLNSHIQVTGKPRYAQLASSHELYCAGHLIQAAIAAHRTAVVLEAAGTSAAAPDFKATADSLFAVATRFADHLVDHFLGHEGNDGHPIIETALAELYRETGHEPYLRPGQPVPRAARPRPHRRLRLRQPLPAGPPAGPGEPDRGRPRRPGPVPGGRDR